VVEGSIFRNIGKPLEMHLHRCTHKHTHTHTHTHKTCTIHIHTYTYIRELHTYRHQGCFFSILWGRYSGNHLQEDLAKFGYRPGREVEAFRNPAIFWRHAPTYCLNLAISETTSTNSGDFGQFFPKESIVWVAMAYVLSPRCKILHRKKRAKNTLKHTHTYKTCAHTHTPT